MKPILCLSLVLLSVAVTPAESGCDCRKVGEETLTSWGNSPYAIELAETYPSLGGSVVDSQGDCVEGALLEVFDHPEAGKWFGDPAGSGKKQQKRLAACRAGEEGRFCFRLPAGEYEFRASRAGFDAVVLRVRVKPGGKVPAKPLEVFLQKS